ncbi:MAG: hypothetical protein M1840_009180 [Geoglossum simile]|nr:MAG: hypothetical protein M1840_009180 [Geoglossum simile]
MAAQPQAQIPLAPQPDFDIISHCHTDLARELNGCRNVPAFDQGAQILNKIRALWQDVNRIESCLKAGNINNVARLSNSVLTSPNGSLSPLNSVADNAPIANFPVTPADLMSLPGPAVNALLRSLGLEVGGTIGERRQRLRLQAGLKVEPI